MMSRLSRFQLARFLRVYKDESEFYYIPYFIILFSLMNIYHTTHIKGFFILVNISAGYYFNINEALFIVFAKITINN